MARPPHPQARLIHVALVAALAAVLVAGVAGCHTTEAAQGQSGVTASFYGRTLTAEIPGAVPVQAVSSAAQSALRARGYTITSASASGDYTRVTAATPRAGILDQLVVRGRLSSDATRIEVTVEPFGDETRSRAVLDAILASLGR
jgi:hypothetical protein